MYTRAMTTDTAAERLITPTDGCCSQHGSPLDATTAERMAAKLKALSDPTRLRVLSHVAAQGCESVCACDLVEVLDISQPTIQSPSEKLVDAGLLTREQRGKWAHYTIVQDAFTELRDFFKYRLCQYEFGGATRGYTCSDLGDEARFSTTLERRMEEATVNFVYKTLLHCSPAGLSSTLVAVLISYRLLEGKVTPGRDERGLAGP